MSIAERAPIEPCGATENAATPCLEGTLQVSPVHAPATSAIYMLLFFQSTYDYQICFRSLPSLDSTMFVGNMQGIAANGASESADLKPALSFLEVSHSSGFMDLKTACPIRGTDGHPLRSPFMTQKKCGRNSFGDDTGIFHSCATFLAPLECRSDAWLFI